MTNLKSDPAPHIFEMGLSYVSCPGSGRPLRPLTLGQLVDEAAKKWGAHECIYDVPMEKRVSFGQLKKEVDWLASGLLDIGLSKGDRIGILGPNSCGWIITFLAAAKVGIIIVPLSIGYEASELLYALNHLSVKCLVLAEGIPRRDFYKILNQALPDMKISSAGDNKDDELKISTKIRSTMAPHLNTIIYMGNEQLMGTQLWTDVQTKGKAEKSMETMNRVAATVQCDDVLYTPFTSGTTGRPKGVMLSHHGGLNPVFGLKPTYSNLTLEDRQCLTLPLYHYYGILIGIFQPFCFGCSIVIPSPTFSPSIAIKIAAEEKCTWIHGTPTMHSDMLNSPGFDSLDLSSLKAAGVGAASSAKSLLAKMKQKYGISGASTGYATTEGGCFTASRLHDPPQLIYTSVGFPLENMEIKIIDSDGRIVPVGVQGEICGRSPFIMQGYWEDPEKTRETIDHARWYHTGDVGHFMESGHLVLVGRLQDMLIRGGENIYPKEIEDFLYQNLSEEIEEVHVFGVSDERLGEVVAAWIHPKEGVTMDTALVKAACEGKISRSKIPLYIKIVNKEDFPRTPIGKVQKNVLRQQYEQELGLSVQESP